MNYNRRKFLKNIGLTGASLIVSTKMLTAANSQGKHKILQKESNAYAGDPIRIALIGAGGMGVEDMQTALTHSNIQIIAVCDLYKGRLNKAKERWGSQLFLTQDYKQVLERTDVDAVIIGTPDHWHKQISIDALIACKHVYCEKPMVHSIAEGQAVIDAWKKSKKIFMVGSQGLSSLGNEKAKELLESGVIGDLNYAEGFFARMSPQGAWQYEIPTDASLDTVDWARYISNTTDRPFDAMRFFRWRNYLDYGTGMGGDLFVHLFSSLHFITSSMGPNKIASTGGLRFWKDGREVPDVLLGMFDYPQSNKHPAFNLSLRCNFADGTSGNTYLKLVGSKGSLNVGWDQVTLTRNSDTEVDPFLIDKKRELASEYQDRKHILPPKETIYKVEDGYKGAHYDHFGNFFRAIKNGGAVVEDPIFAFRACAPALLCNDSYRANKFLYWDPVNMQVIKN